MLAQESLVYPLTMGCLAGVFTPLPPLLGYCCTLGTDGGCTNATYHVGRNSSGSGDSVACACKGSSKGQKHRRWHQARCTLCLNASSQHLCHANELCIAAIWGSSVSVRQLVGQIGACISIPFLFSKQDMCRWQAVALGVVAALAVAAAADLFAKRCAAASHTGPCPDAFVAVLGAATQPMAVVLALALVRALAFTNPARGAAAALLRALAIPVPVRLRPLCPSHCIPVKRLPLRAMHGV